MGALASYFCIGFLSSLCPSLSLSLSLSRLALKPQISKPILVRWGQLRFPSISICCFVLLSLYKHILKRLMGILFLLGVGWFPVLTCLISKFNNIFDMLMGWERVGRVERCWILSRAGREAGREETTPCVGVCMRWSETLTLCATIFTA